MSCHGESDSSLFFCIERMLLFRSLDNAGMNAQDVLMPRAKEARMKMKDVMFRKSNVQIMYNGVLSFHRCEDWSVWSMCIAAGTV